MTDFIMHSDQPLSCAHVESLASEWVDGALALETRAAIDAHLDACDACASLLADLAAIASEARALPRLAPSRDLWAGVAARIETPVAVLQPRRVSAAPRHQWWKAAVAAAALVAVTAGVTWRLATDSVQRETIAAGAQTPISAPGASATGSAPVLAPTTVPDSGPAAVAMPTPAVTQVAARGSRTPSGARQAAATGGRRSAPATSAVVAAPLPVAAQAYDREIAGMRMIITERRKDLDPTTVRVLERNLRIIDQAIAESRAALAQDPASGLLAEQLTRAMKRKLELLRTAADLPARIS